MQDKSRDIYLIQKILKYCEDISQAHIYFKNSFNEFQNNSVYRIL